MNEKEIIENNKLIAEFMGDYVWDDVNKLAVSLKIRVKDEDELKYHSDWNWIMPVIKKCYTSPPPNKDGYSKAERIEWRIDNYDIWQNNIFGVFESVVKFIKWYNEEKIK